jgi:flavin-binding protein dodecin
MPPTGTTLRDLRVAEVVKQDLDLGGAGDTVIFRVKLSVIFRVKLSVSFKYEGSSS